VLIATAGHVDHGKTSLIKQLTGTDTDKLKEEKQRGFSINLGYAYLTKNNKTIGFIDVPGHHRFINTMISGVSGIDLALVVVAANEGIKPQTIEHLEILHFLSIKRFLLVLTHIDKANTNQCKLVSKEMQRAIGSEAPIFKIDNIKGVGVNNLRNYLLNAAEDNFSRSKKEYFRLSIDRAFLLKGVGLTVTGTVQSGRVSEGDKLILLPLKKSVRVREIYAQNKKTKISWTGERCALQISGIEKKDIKKGDWLHGRFDIKTSNRINVRLQISTYLKFQVKHLAPVKLYIGAKLARAKLYLLNRKIDGFSLAAGANVFSQIIVEEEISCFRGDKFILRDDSELVTLGGGHILDPWAKYDPRFNEIEKNYLQALEMPTPLDTLVRLAIKEKCLVNLTKFELLQNLYQKELAVVLQDKQLAKNIKVFSSSNQMFIVSSESWDQNKRKIVIGVKEFHKNHPHLLGVSMDQLSVYLEKFMDEVLLISVVDELVHEKVLIQVNGQISISNFVRMPSHAESTDWEMIKRTIRGFHKQIPTLSNIKENIPFKNNSLEITLKKAIKERRLYQLGENRFILPDSLLQYSIEIKEFSIKRSSFLVSEVKDVLGLGRNSCVDLMEYLDHLGFTRRIDSKRIINDPDAVARYCEEK